MTKHTSDSSVDVAIVGLGPTGLTLAHFLGRYGLSVVVLEREPEFYGNARAVYTDDECLRIFQSVGVAEALFADMMTNMPVQLAYPDGEVLTRYCPLSQPWGWPVTNFFYQPYLETKLADLLEQYGNVKILRGREVTAFEQDDSSVTIHHERTHVSRFTESSASGDAGEDMRELKARYLVGCDGGRSIVRTALGIEMTGKSFPEPWLVVDLKSKTGQDALRHIPYFSFYCDPSMPTVSCPQPDGYHRFEFMLMPGCTKEHMEHPDTVRTLISRYVDPDLFEVKRKLVYTFNALIAERWRDGRVFLAGDAAHMTPQFMGQGMNSGVRDAANLGWKLAMVVKGLADDKLLDSYQSERFDHAKAMIDRSVFLKDAVSLSNPKAAKLRDLAIKAIKLAPAFHTFLMEKKFKPAPIYTKGCYLGLPRNNRVAPEGSPIPQPDVRDITGRYHKLDDILGDGFSLVGNGLDPRDYLSADLQQQLSELGITYLSVVALGCRRQALPGSNDQVPSNQLFELEDTSGELPKWFGQAGYARGGVALVRPDRFVFSLRKPEELETVVRELISQIGVQAGHQSQAA